jgi:hypothetical protein
MVPLQQLRARVVRPPRRDALTLTKIASFVSTTVRVMTNEIGWCEIQKPTREIDRGRAARRSGQRSRGTRPTSPPSHSDVSVSRSTELAWTASATGAARREPNLSRDSQGHRLVMMTTARQIFPRRTSSMEGRSTALSTAAGGALTLVQNARTVKGTRGYFVS